jgi:hypothetical protein
VPKSDLLALNGYQVKILDKKWIGLIPEVPYEATRCVDGNQFIYSNAYRLEINNLPFPFGFPTNQYEYNALLPFYGNKEIQSVYIAQWILLYLIMQRLTNRRVNSP